jgi:hypothetical protein
VAELKPGMVAIREVKLGDDILLAKDTLLDGAEIQRLVETAEDATEEITVYVRF